MPLSARSSEAFSANTRANARANKGHARDRFESRDTRLIAYAHHAENRDAVERKPNLAGNSRLPPDCHSRRMKAVHLIQRVDVQRGDVGIHIFPRVRNAMF